MLSVTFRPDISYIIKLLDGEYLRKYLPMLHIKVERSEIMSVLQHIRFITSETLFEVI